MTNDYGNLELHTVLLSAMKDIDRICRENGLRYYLHAGTLLGALNHKGFIPWDDDVDISLLREDYEKLCQILQRDHGTYYFLHNYLTDDNYTNNRSVLRILGTKVTRYHNTNESRCEIGVDLVPLDAAPNSRLLQKLQQAIIWTLDTAVKIKQGDIEPHHPVVKLIGLLSKLPRKQLGQLIDCMSTAFNKFDTEYVGLLSYTWKSPFNGRSGYENDLMRREWFMTPCIVPFEDAEFMTISNADSNMEYRYGPHWAEPYPEEKRITKHDVKSYEISPEVRERVGL